MRMPDFFIVGAPKCGTTAMFYYLKQHPEIFMPEQKEPRFFSSDLDSGTDRDSRGEVQRCGPQQSPSSRSGRVSRLCAV